MKRIFFIVLVFSISCKEAYDPPVISTDHAYLVVEGFINSGADSTVITLSHTYKLNDTAQATPELSAQVSVEGNDNSTYPLGETGNGNYGAVLSLNPTNTYRLRIVTTGGGEYVSDFVPVRNSPPIDSVNWVRTGDGVQIYVNTHDPQHASTYYRWDFTETWQFHSVYYSEYEYLPLEDTIVNRPTADSFYTCWKSDVSSGILLGSSAKLAQDVIFQAPLVLIPKDSWHLSVEYSILVRQYVLTENGYNFWLNMQRNTEQLGSVFSPQPSEVGGNIHSVTDPTEVVIGYIGAGTLSQMRLFINENDVPNWTSTTYDGENVCQPISILGVADSERFALGSGEFIPTQLDPTVPIPIFPPFRYDIADKYCVDCTQIGTNHKPSFWP